MKRSFPNLIHRSKASILSFLVIRAAELPPSPLRNGENGAASISQEKSPLFHHSLSSPPQYPTPHVGQINKKKRNFFPPFFQMKMWEMGKKMGRKGAEAAAAAPLPSRSFSSAGGQAAAAARVGVGGGIVAPGLALAAIVPSLLLLLLHPANLAFEPSPPPISPLFSDSEPSGLMDGKCSSRSLN